MPYPNPTIEWVDCTQGEYRAASNQRAPRRDIDEYGTAPQLKNRYQVDATWLKNHREQRKPWETLSPGRYMILPLETSPFLVKVTPFGEVVCGADDAPVAGSWLASYRWYPVDNKPCWDPGEDAR